YQYVAVFDPSAGYVTGAGWIDSPPGAYTPDPSDSGRAIFGFVSRYLRGQSTPDGNTRFNFLTARLRFQSTSYDWLVVAGPQAKYKGSGTINGIGDYGFMLTAIDGQINGGGGIDKFRIKIWDKATEEVVYDNQLGDPDDGDATDAIEAGNITIHQEAVLPKSGRFAEDIEPEAKPKQFALFQNHPNPFNPETMISFQIPQSNHVIVRIFNTLGVEIRKVVNARYEAGNYWVIWDGKDNSGNTVSSGTYIYQIRAGQFVDMKKMVLVR
ncbi:MAG: T9SS type A sorting domain-containing protein, partial [bacterium]